MPIKQYIDKLAYIYLNPQKQILVTLSKGKDTWYIPGGKRDGDETDQKALIREVKEELTVSLIPQTIQFYGVFQAQAHGKPEGTVVRMTCYMADFMGDISPSSEIEKIAYFNYSQKELTSPVDHLIFDDLYQKGLII